MADVITRLKLESGEYDSKIKRATQGLLQMETECRKVGGTLAILEKDQLEFVKGLGKMETVSTSARGKLGELTQAYTELAVQYKRLTNEEKNGDFGRALNASLQQLKGRINETKNQLADVNRELNASGGKFGEFGNIIDTIGSKFGVSGNLTEMLTSKTALMTAGIGASIAIITKATEAWAGYNAELAKQDQITTVTTGLKGDAANQMTDQARALADTYNVDFREAINAANTLMTQFGESGEQAMQLIKDGMQGMIQGDGPKLLQMIQQYAPAFRDAGVSASQLIAVIQNSEGGIFTDQNMNAIVMGIKNIRLMTKATSDALAQLGIDGQKMSKQLSDGSMTIFDALKQVAGAIGNVDSNSKAAGEVMQQVFGRQGVTAGTNLGKAIETLNTNLEETKKQTGEVGDAFNDLYEANLRLNTAIRDAFGYDGWDQMAKGIQSKLVSALASVIEKLGVIRRMLTGGDWSIKDKNEEKPDNNKGYTETRDKSGRLIKATRNGKDVTNEVRGKVESTYTESIDSNGNVVAATRNGKNVTKEVQKVKNKPTKRGGSGGGSKKTKAEQTELQQNQTKINALTQEYVKLGDDATEAARERQEEIRKEIALLEERNNLLAVRAEQAKGKLLNDIPGVSMDVGGGVVTKTMQDTMDNVMPKDGLKLDEKDMKAVTKQITDQNNKKIKDSEKSEVSISKGISSVAGGVSQMVGGLEQLGVEIPQGLKDVLGGIQAIATILTGISALVSIVTAIQGTKAVPVIGFLAAHGGVVKAAGGTVTGTTYSGDQIPALLNAGEVVLNRAQVSNLASTLEGGGMQGMKLSAVISGEQIRLVLNNNGRRTGKGEYIQTNSR